ncbi:hypothetical protein ACHAXM_003978, partial [Skeletonema potamos]
MISSMMSTLPPSIITSRKRRRQRRLLLLPSSLLVLSLSVTICLFLSCSGLLLQISAKEITATSEWQLLGENDTIPAGLHVRVDLSTGEKWAKLPNDDDAEADEKIKAAAVEDEGGSSSPVVNVATMDASGALTIVPDYDNNDTNNDSSDDSRTTKRDYTMMHRVMSQLPPEELEPFGGLPALPSSSSNSSTKLTAKEKQEFEAKMELLWQKRQEELKKLEDSIADLPKMLKERIGTIKGYLMDSNAKLMEILEERHNDDDDDDDQDEEDYDDDDDGKANNVVKALRDLEFLLSDVDMARDFHTLGGWPYLIALLDETLHDVNNDDDRTAAAAALVDEVRALAATTIGTAVGNLGEFRPWALEDVSSTIHELRNNTMVGDEKVTALSLLTQVFKQELDQRTEAMAGGTMAVEGPSNTIAKAKSRATYKLRAIYGLGSLLRGNPTAQQMFISNNGPELLVRNVLGTLSNVRGPTEISLSRLDYKFASKVLALGEDIVMDVVLHDQDYVQTDESTSDGIKDKYAAEGVVTANQLVASFTTEQWCDLSLRMLSPPTEVVGETISRGIKERALGAVRAMAPSCQLNQGDRGDSWGVEEVKRVRAEWNREGSGD